MNTGRKLAASACALLMAASTATGVFAADDISNNATQQQPRPAQEMMQGQKAEKGPNIQANGSAQKQDNSNVQKQDKQQANGSAQQQMAPREMNGENRPADLPEMNEENKPADLPEINGENRPADLPEMNGENKPADMQEMKDGKRPSGPKEAGDVLNEISKSGNSSDETVQGLVDDYSNAVDAERNATDSEAKLTAAKLVKQFVDAINSVLEKMGITMRINAPADKPEVPSTNLTQKTNA